MLRGCLVGGHGQIVNLRLAYIGFFCIQAVPVRSDGEGRLNQMNLRYYHRGGLGARTICGKVASVKRWASMGMAVLALCLAASEGQAQEGSSSTAGAFRPSLSVTPYYQGKADLDGGGSFSTAGAITRLGVTTRLGDKGFWGLVLNYDYTDYRFSDAGGFGGAAPWNDVERVGLGVPFNLITGNWGWLIAPSVDYFREKGAVWNDSLTYGAIFSGARMFSSGRLGLGLGVFNRLDEVKVFPFVAIDWRLSENWRLTNPLAAGPTGPAGIEARYVFASGWEIGAGGAYRSVRFRLNDSGPAVGGIGEERGVVAFLHVSRALDRRLSLDFYAGAVFDGRLKLEDSQGNTLTQVDFDTAPLVGLTLSARL
jgi:hypothetical protein